MYPIKYSILVDTGQDLPYCLLLKSRTDHTAIRDLKAWMSNNPLPEDTNVFLCFENPKQGFSAYINPDGNASATGKSWS